MRTQHIIIGAALMAAFVMGCSTSSKKTSTVRFGSYVADNWRVRLPTAVVGITCMAAGMLLGPAVGINVHGFWPLMLLLVVAIIVGNVLGRLVCRLLFRPPSGGLPDHPPRA